MTGNKWFACGASLAGLAVALGAFAAHGLQSREGITPKDLEIFETGARYQMYHAFGLMLLALWFRKGGNPLSTVAAWSLLLGTVIFSGSLYALALTGIKILGAIVPIGGVLFIVGWTSASIAALREPEQPANPG